MARICYSLLLYLLSPLLVLYLLFRAIKSPDYRSRWAERFGLSRLAPCHVVVHSVSMGETLAALPLIRAMLARRPELKITVTTSSPTGSAEVLKALGDRVQHCYLPFDLGFAVKRFISMLQCDELIIMETELWPNLIASAKASGARVTLLNARLSQKSAASYAKYAALTGPMLKSLDCVAVQTQTEAQRFIALGVAPERVKVCGSLKFDIAISDELLDAARSLRAGWARELVWVAGSVHPGEFEAMLAAHTELLNSRPDALLILVPRHPEQFANAAKAIEKAGLAFARRSLAQLPSPDVSVLLGDTMGELLTWYGAADVAFVGGTLVENGGHNPLEPAAMGLPVAIGPHIWNFKDIAGMLAAAGNLEICPSAAAFSQWLVTMANSEAQRQRCGQAGLDVVATNRGALDRQLAAIGY